MKLQINLPFSLWSYKISGVYKITFEDGSFYIGCSSHLRRRAGCWDSLMRTGKGDPSKSIRTLVFDKIKTLSTAILDIVELCAPVDLSEREAFYLNKYKGDKNMVSSEHGGWNAVLQYTEAGVFVKKHFSISAAARYSGGKISYIQRVLSGERKTYNGMVFVFEYQYQIRREKIVKSRRWRRERKLGRNIIMLATDGVEVNRFKKIKDAAKAVGCKEENIARAISGCQKTAKGYVFKYE